MNDAFRTFLAAVLVLAFSVSCEAQLFKKAAERRSQRQSGGSMNSTEQSRGGLFQRARERRETREIERHESQNSAGDTKTGLFGRPKENGGGLFSKNKQNGSLNDSSRAQKPGLFERMREKKYERQEQNYVQSRSSGSSNSSLTYVRSSQRVTDNGNVFERSRQQQQQQSQNSSPVLALTSTAAAADPLKEEAVGSSLPAVVQTETAPVPERRQPAARLDRSSPGQRPEPITPAGDRRFEASGHPKLPQAQPTSSPARLEAPSAQSLASFA